MQEKRGTLVEGGTAFPQPSRVPHDLNLSRLSDSTARDSIDGASKRDDLRDLADEKDNGSREILSALRKQQYRQKWRSSGPLPRAPVWGELSWRGDKQPKQMIGTTHGVGIYELQRFLKPSEDPASAAAFPVLPKTPASELKVRDPS